MTASAHDLAASASFTAASPTVVRAARAAIAQRNAATKAAFIADSAALALMLDARDRQRAAAEAADAGMLVLNGTGGRQRFVGSPPDWYADPFGDVGYLHGLNRLPHWRALLGEHLVSDEPRWAERVVFELRDWLKRCPAPDPADPRLLDVLVSGYGTRRPPSPWHLLDVGIRAFGPWRLALIVLADNPALDDATFARWLDALVAHAELLLVGTPMIWPRLDNNHALMESLGLLTIGCLVRESPRADLWRASAAERLATIARAQITEAGGQIEGCPGYHNGCVGWFVQAALTADEHGVDLDPVFHARVRRMSTYTLHALRPDGTTVPWGDSAPARDGTAAALWSWLLDQDDDALARVATLVGRDEALRSCERLLWTVPGFAALRRCVGRMPTASIAAPRWHRDAELGQAMLRTGWSSAAASVFFACRSPTHNGHAHVDPMGFDFCALGRPLVVDPSYLTYRDGDDRRRFKSPESHACVTIDGRWPFEMHGSWGFGPQPTGGVHAVQELDGGLAALARLDWLDGGRHERLLVLLDVGALLVVDRVVGSADAAVANAWYPIDAPMLSWDRCARIARTGDSTPGLLFAASAGVGTVLPFGVSTATDVEHPGQRLRLDIALAAGAPTAWATLLVPFTAVPPTGVETDCRTTVGGAIGRCAIADRAWRWRWEGDRASLTEEAP